MNLKINLIFSFSYKLELVIIAVGKEIICKCLITQDKILLKEELNTLKTLDYLITNIESDLVDTAMHN
jgi:hypothetical protein